MTLKTTSLFSTILFGFSLLCFCLAGCQDDDSLTLNVSAAASMTDALSEINELYIQTNDNVNILANFASSGTLRQQIEIGAPADVFISASVKHMNTLEEAGLILPDTRNDLLNNKVVLIVPEHTTLNLDDFSDLCNDDIKQIAMGDPEFVPAGNYGKQALDLFGIYTRIQSKLILGSDVRQVLSYVESGNVDAGIVYSTDAAISDKVRIVADGPGEINAGIVYPIAVVQSSAYPEAAVDYIEFLYSDAAAGIFKKYGFSMVGR
jgi:molybdate transport system substrate-binding protein